MQQGRRARKLAKQAVRRFAGFHEAPRSWVSNSRISHMEIKGTKRTKSSSSQPKKPIEPTSIVQSQMVGQNMPQAEGRKSRCWLVTISMKRWHALLSEPL